jgi:hypothetical protein
MRPAENFEGGDDSEKEFALFQEINDLLFIS